MAQLNNNTLDRLVVRLKKIGVNITLAGNYPWIYLNEVNGKRVEETFLADHGFTIAWYPSKPGAKIEITDISRLFKVIRKYVDQE